ncbi:hypothetical protein E2C01_030524 [Portunus trituberculatus]|uniref:Uncharacterized protein n=1 Tax=Portunus trituberculatus TaxID=210409 RepID=A0A5B7ER22_PORTR|nr:hypothetical protein [Portunus trituberculatus]
MFTRQDSGLGKVAGAAAVGVPGDGEGDVGREWLWQCVGRLGAAKQRSASEEISEGVPNTITASLPHQRHRHRPMSYSLSLILTTAATHGRVTTGTRTLWNVTLKLFNTTTFKSSRRNTRLNSDKPTPFNTSPMHDNLSHLQEHRCRLLGWRLQATGADATFPPRPGHA